MHRTRTASAPKAGSCAWRGSCFSVKRAEVSPMFTVGGRQFKVRREGREAGLFSVWAHDEKCAGYFAVEPATGAVTICGRYSNVLDSPEALIAIAEQFLNSRMTWT
jgi:hypothetical protein